VSNVSELVLITIAGPVATLTISRESALNALDAAVLIAFLEAAQAVEQDQAIRCVLVTGAGAKAFVAGADIAAMATMGPAQALELSHLGNRVGLTIGGSRLPWIACVNGFALGGGCELALACDFIYASKIARFGQPEVNLGVIPGFGGTQRLLRRVGIAKARELVLTGHIIAAEEALRIGLCDAIFAPDELMARAGQTALELAAKGPLALAAAKRVMNEGQSLPLSEALEAEARAFAQLFSTSDQKEGMAAFLAKRPAQFTGK
jgi:enoyl-CoA hydratase